MGPDLSTSSKLCLISLNEAVAVDEIDSEGLSPPPPHSLFNFLTDGTEEGRRSFSLTVGGGGGGWALALSGTTVASAIRVIHAHSHSSQSSV